MQKCEKCDKGKEHTYHNGHTATVIDLICFYPDAGKWLCSDCYLGFLRQRSPTGLVRVPCYLRAQ